MKADQYWASVTEEYNKSKEPCRKRNKNQLKIRWDRVKKPVSEFHGSWVQTNGVYRSGYSDQQLMEMAEKMYYTSHNDRFHFEAYMEGCEKRKEVVCLCQQCA
jgi:hypothetical protein